MDLNLKYKIQSDYDLIYRMYHNLKGIRTKSEEVFGSSGDGGFSTKHGFKSLFNEIKIRFDNNQNLFF